jgi:hypothetical protein
MPAITQARVTAHPRLNAPGRPMPADPIHPIPAHPARSGAEPPAAPDGRVDAEARVPDLEGAG